MTAPHALEEDIGTVASGGSWPKYDERVNNMNGMAYWLYERGRRPIPGLNHAPDLARAAEARGLKEKGDGGRPLG